VTSVCDCAEVVKAAIDVYGRLDILVNATTRRPARLRRKKTGRDHPANLKSVFNCSRVAVRQMMKQRYGRIVNITWCGHRRRRQTNYSAAKADHRLHEGDGQRVRGGILG
jgi:3-oxoacyl-[acyl-carrier protein] reductase